MEFLKRRSRAELGVLAAMLLAVAVGVAAWNLVLSDVGDDGAQQGDIVAIAEATLTARAAVPEPTAAPPMIPTPTSPPAAALAPTAWDGVCRPDSFATDIPVSVPRGDPSFPDWYGSDVAGLWVAPVDRAGLSADMFRPTASRWFTGHKTFLMWYGANDPIRVTGEQLGGDATFDVTEPDVTNPQVNSQWPSFEIPEPGCWRITGQAGDKSLTIEVEVLPVEERPDVVFAQQFRPDRPYPVPSTCPVTPWVGPESRFNHYIAQYWIDADDVTVGTQGWLLAEDSDKVLAVYGDDVAGPFTAIATRLDGESRDVIEANTSIWASVETAARAVRFAFPEPGCWQLDLTAESGTTTIVVYVYPADCGATFEAGEVLVDCEPPA